MPYNQRPRNMSKPNIELFMGHPAIFNSLEFHSFQPSVHDFSDFLNISVAGHK